MSASTEKSNGHKPTVKALAATKRLPVEHLRQLGLRDVPNGVAIPYFDAAGNELFERTRQTLTGKNVTMQPAGVKLAAYGSERIGLANKAGVLFILEGESDPWTLWHYDLPALGIPGSGAAKVIEAEHVEAVGEVYVSVEPGQGGAGFLAGVRARLSALGFCGKVFALRMPDGVKDPSDLHIADPDRFRERFEAAVAAATPVELTRPKQSPRNGPAKPPAAPKRPPRRLEPYTPAPLDVLPPPLNGYISEAATALGCDPAFVMLPVLSVIASVIGNTRAIQLKRGWLEPSVIWSAVVADSGTLKTPAYQTAVQPMQRLQRRLRKRFLEKCAQHQEELERFEETKKKAKDGGPAPGEPPEKPVLQRVVVSDTTIEKLAEILEENPRGLLLARDELAGWLSSFTRYKGKAGVSDLPNWLEIFRAGPITSDRKTGERPSLYVPHAAVSICGGIQPGVLAAAFSQDFLDAGGGARLLMAMPPKLAKRWSDLEVHPDTEQAYETLLDSLLALDLEKDRDGEKAPVVLKLSREAKTVWVAFYNEWGKEQAASEGEIAAALAKLEAYAARFALLHHVVGSAYRHEDDRREIGPESVAAGVKLCLWFAAEARRIYSVLGESEEERDTRRLVEFIRSRPGNRITVRQLQKSNGRKYLNVEAAEAVLNVLADTGAADWIEGEIPLHGGHRPRWLVLMQTPDTSDTRLDDDDDKEPIPSDTRADTRHKPCLCPVENGRVSEVSGVGQEEGETTSDAAAEQVPDARRSSV